jgi:uncharacterized protein DUF3311
MGGTGCWAHSARPVCGNCESCRRVRRPSIASLLLAILPFVGMCFTVPLWDRVLPTVMGVPFNMFWMMAWIVLTSAILSVIYCLERRR